jgi:hypothetical protein
MPGSRHLTPYVSLHPAAVGQGGPGDQRQHGMYLRDGEHLAGRGPIASRAAANRSPANLVAADEYAWSRSYDYVP